MAAAQARLFPAPQPLVERLGVGFFRGVPKAPGVYLMAGDHERLLYIGQARCLRARLNSYRHLRPETAARKLIRLIHLVRSITWEVCASPEAALLRENELLRLHKPRFNVMNVRPEQYCYIGVRLHGGELQVRLTRRSVSLPGETLHGAFKSLGRVQAGLAALLRLLWASEHRPAGIHDFPRRLFSEPSPEAPGFVLPLANAGDVVERLRGMLEGEDEDWGEAMAAAARVEPGWDLCRQRLHEADGERLRLFHEFGPRRNRTLREQAAWDASILPPAALDDLLAMRSGARAHSMSPGGA